MFYKAIVIEGVDGDVEITHTDHGAMVTCHHQILCEVGRGEDRDARYAKARTVAGMVYGTKRGQVLGTNSMIRDVLDAIERVAGC